MNQVTMSGSELFGTIAIILAAAVFIAGGYTVHLHSVVKSIIREEKARLNTWAIKRAEKLAQQRFAELLCNVRINIPVELINESDIDWGESSDKAA